MVFLRPVVMRDGETTGRLSIDRYELMRAFQQDRQPTPSVLLPVESAPVLPPLAAPSGPPVTAPLRPQPAAPAPLTSMPDQTLVPSTSGR